MTSLITCVYHFTLIKFKLKLMIHALSIQAGIRNEAQVDSLKVFLQKLCSSVRHLVVDKLAGRRKRADLYFSREERVRLLRLLSH